MFNTGIGYSMIGINMMVSIYYNVILALAVLYLAASFTSHLPWTDCDNWWNLACFKQHQSKLSPQVISAQYRSASTQLLDTIFHRQLL